MSDISLVMALKAQKDIKNLQNANANPNIFNKNTIINNNFIASGTGNLSAGTGFVASDYIPIQGSTKYVFTALRHIAFYDGTKTYISGVTANPIKNPYTSDVTPFNAAYMRFSWYLPGDAITLDQQVVKKYVPVGITPTPILPATIYGVVGKEINIYFQNILRDSLSKYQIEVTSSIGQQLSNKWTCIPNTAGTYPITLDIYSDFVNLVGSVSTNLVVKTTSVGNGVNKKVITIGDSTLNAGIATQRLLDLMTADVMDVTLYGSRGTTPNVHEGRGGWSASTYLTNTIYDGDSLINPFYNAGTFDFSYYMTQKGYPVPDYVVIWLGINDVFSPINDVDCQTSINTALTNYDTIINKIKAYNTNIKIGVNITIPPNENQDAFGLSYNSGQTQWRYKRNQHMWIEQLINHFKTMSGVYLIPMNSNIDTKNGFDISSNGGVHPNTTGYNQMGDTLYYWLKSFES